ncbi:MAG TPA: hypothetical protein VGM05_28595 [Planctomycetaceae bacterium]|jgi:hypothetical protein
MAKKKPAKNKKSAAGRAAAKKPVRKPVAVRKPVKQNPRQGARVVPRKKKPPVASAPIEAAPSLGRPKVTGEEDLDLFFKEDYHARQIFKFLNVRTLKDLERYSAGEILRRLSNPIKETVERIRRSLAHHNRCLNGDETYALEHKEEAAKILKGA